MLAIPKRHALARRGDVGLDAAAGADFVSFKRDEARAFFDQTLNFCTEDGFRPTIRCEAGTVFGVLNLVAAGVGVAIVPASCSSAADEKAVMRRLVRPVRPGGLALVKRKVDRDPAVEGLGSMMREAFEALQAIVDRKLAG